MSKAIYRALAVIFCLAFRSVEAQVGVPALDILSLDPTGAQGSGDATQPAISKDGGLLVFTYDKDDLMAGDTNNVSDVFLRNVATGGLARLSVVPGNPPLQGKLTSDQPGISGSGRVAAFRSLSTFLAVDDNRHGDIYLWDLDLRVPAFELVSIALDGQAGDGASSGPPSLDESGNLVVFLSASTDLSTTRGNGNVQVYLRDRLKRTTYLISLTPNNKNAAAGDSTAAAISSDGNWVAFASQAEDIVPGDENRAADIFLRDLRSGVTMLVSRRPDLRPGNLPSDSPSLSADGRWVAFASLSTVFDPLDREKDWDIYLFDRLRGTLELITRPPSIVGVPAPLLDGDSVRPSISSGGERIAFQSKAAFVLEDANDGLSDVYIHDRPTGAQALISRNGQGLAGNGPSDFAKLSGDGLRVVFQSMAFNLAPDRNRTAIDVFGQKLPGPPVVADFSLQGNLLFYAGGFRLVQLRADGAPSGRDPVQLSTRDPPIASTMDDRGVFWIRMQSGEILQLRGDDLSILPGKLTLPAQGAVPPLLASGGMAWVAAPPAVLGIDPTGDVTREVLGKATSIAIALDPFGSLWAAESEAAGNRLVQLTRRLDVVRSIPIRETIAHLASDHLGNLHALTAGEILKYSPSGAILYRIKLPGAAALAVDGMGHAVAIHRNGTSWFGRNGDERFFVKHAAALPADTSVGLALDGQGRTWITIEGQGDVLRVDNRLPAVQREARFPLGKGLTNGEDLMGDRSGFFVANAVDPKGDLDGDSLANRIEIANGFDPLSSLSPGAGKFVLPVLSLAGRSTAANQVALEWTNGAGYRQVRVFRDGKEINGSPFPGGTTQINDNASGGPHIYKVIGVGSPAGGELPADVLPGGGGLDGSSPEVTAVVVVGDGNTKASIDLPEGAYAVAHFPQNGGRVIVSSSESELPVFDTLLVPVDTVFPHPAPGGEIRGIEYDATAPGGRLLFLLSDRRVFRTATDGTGAVHMTTLSGGPLPAEGSYTSLSLRNGTLYTILGPGYDCLVGFQGSNGQFTGDSGLSGPLGYEVEQALGLSVSGDRIFVGVGEVLSQAITDAVQFSFVGEAIVSAGVNMPLDAIDTNFVSDIEYVPNLGLLAVDAENRKLYLLDANLEASPVIESIVPAGGPTGGGTVVTLGLKNLRSQADTSVFIAGIATPIETYGNGPDPSRKVVTVEAPAHAAGGVRVEVVTSDGRSFVDPGFAYNEAPPGTFIRGDADRSGVIDLTDPTFTLNFLFLGGVAPPCRDAADADDSGELDITDASYLINFLFLGGVAPRPPFPAAGPDPTTDDPLTCAAP